MSTAAQDDPASRVRASVAKTRAERTARIRYMANFREGLPGLTDALAKYHPGAANVVGAAGGLLRRVISAVPTSTMTGPDGRTDFESERSVYSNGAFWKFYAPGREYIGEPGEWEQPEELDVLADDDPFWLLALLTATVEATARGNEKVLGTPCERYGAVVDFSQVPTTEGRPIVPPFHALDTPSRDEKLNLSRLPFDVWLDASGRIRRAVLHGGSGSLTQIELSGFGEPDPITLPQPDEILADE